MLGEVTNPVCLSGGAKGADTVWGMAARSVGHDVVHWSFNGHRSADALGVCVLDKDRLMQADPFVKEASKGIRRSFPSRNEHVNDLLRRNHYQVQWSDRVYAVASRIEDASMLGVSGGTAWACQMYVDRWYKRGGLVEPELYLFDQASNQWMQWIETWRVLSNPPRPTGVYAGIGSREITSQGITAIIGVYG